MKKFGLFFFFLTSFTLYSQDTIYTRNGEVIQAKVEEVGLSNIRYKKASNPNGPVYSLAKSDITLIQYKNGSKDVFPVSETISERQAADAIDEQVVERNDDEVVIVRPIVRIVVNTLPGLFFGSWGWGWGWNHWGGCRPLNYGGNHHSHGVHHGRR